MIALIHSIDAGVLEFYHELAVKAGFVLTPFAKIMTLIGEKGFTFLALVVALLFFPQTRKMAVALFGAISCSFLVTDLILKDLIQRARPYMSVENPIFREWWEFVGSPNESGFSFPSGHAAAAAAGFLVLAILWNKKILFLGIPYTAIMCFSRNYLMAHYPSDVFCGVIIGIMSAIISYGITLAIFYFLEKYKNTKFCSFLLTGLDAGKMINKINENEK